MDTKKLEATGLTRGEVRVYLALLKHGETTTGPVIDESGITGSKVYVILNKLIRKGLVSYIIREKTKYFQASPPRRLLDYVNSKEKEIVRQRKGIEELIPQLENLRKHKENIQTSQIFEGYEGIKSVFGLILEIMKPGEEYLAFSAGETLVEKMRIFLRNHHAKRGRMGIRFKIIAKSSEKLLFKKISKAKYFQIRYHKNPFPVGVIIFGDYIVTLTYKEKPTAFLIKSSQIAESYKEFFLNMWSSSE